jgi:NADH-quinone oxidoreductase subunit N
MMPPLADVSRLAPVFIACGFGILIMLVDSFVPRGARGVLARIGLVGALASLAAVGIAARHPGYAFSGLLRIDGFSLFFQGAIFAITVLVMLGSYDYLVREGLPLGEYHALLLFAASGMVVMASAAELLTAFIGLEVSSIASYVLAGYRRNAAKSSESALKYFLLGSFATAFFLYGAAMVYGATGTTILEDVRDRVAMGLAGGALLPLGCAMILVGLGFKIAVAPFQVWTPDVYEGAPTPVTALFASGPKAAAFALLVRILYTAFGSSSGTWFWAIWVSAVLTMFIGNLAALAQNNVKRMLAYSSIAHAGYLLVAFAARSEIGIAALLFYLVVYALVKLGAFTIVAHLGETGERRLDIDSYAGLGTRQPVTAFCLALFLLSLMGLPITAGFLGKLYIFNAALRAQLTGLAVMLAINSVIGAYYYLRLVRVMYFSEPAEEWMPAPVPPGVGAVMLLTTVATVALGLFPGALMAFATISSQSFR